MLYRYVTEEGEGAFRAGRRLLPAELIEEVLAQKSWLIRPQLAEGIYESWFTELGRIQYEQTLKPLHDKYLKLHLISGSPDLPIVYQDEFQVIFARPI